MKTTDSNASEYYTIMLDYRIIIELVIVYFIYILYSFSRYSGIINNGYDYDLNRSYHIILGHSENQGK